MLIVCPACSASYRLAPQALGAGRKVRCARCRTEWYADAPLDAKPPLKAEGLPRAGDPFAAWDDQRSVEPQPDEPEWTLAIDEPERETSPDLPSISGFDEADPVDMMGDAPIDPEPDALAGRRRAGARQPRAGRPGAPPRRRALVNALAKRPALAAAALGVGALFVAILMRADLVEAAPSLASLYARIGMPVNVRGLEISGVRSVEEMEEGAPMLLVTGTIANVARGPRDVPRLRLAVVADDGREVYSWTTVAGRTKIGVGETTQFKARLASPPAEGRRIVVRFLARQDLATHPR
ncbi:zinc-ribbon domain-containing protein [Methylopila sp. 73B]|uniref:MJ0042-type zinc finger domain-containing protein n=1 Tax=Methylopila sp. 73B TaxID=1120792 RepID=UPI0003771FF2|nr:zinc-ribbon domain-containing protein [Methylopila sp. 73B]